MKFSKPSISKMILFVKNRKILSSLIVAALLVAISSGVIYAIQVNKPAAQASQPAKSIVTEKSKEEVKSTPTDVPAVQQNAAPSNTNSQPAAAQPHSTASIQPAPTSPKKAPVAAPTPTPRPFIIDSVRLSDVQYFCGSGSIYLRLSEGIAHTNSSDGGTIAWQVEVTGSRSDPAPSLRNTTMMPNSFYANLRSPFELQHLYIDAFANDGESVRIHVVSPNDVASPWYTIPAGANQSCN